jgi:hypothetical protein
MSWTLTELALDASPQIEVWRDVVAQSGLWHPLLDADYVALVLGHLRHRRSLYWLQHAVTGRADLAGIVESEGRGCWASWYLPQLPVTPFVGAVPAATKGGVGSGLFASLPGPAWRLKLYDVDPACVALPTSVPELAQTGITTHQTVAIEFGSGDYWAERSRELQRNVARSMRKLHA